MWFIGRSSIFNFGFMMKFYDIKKFLSFNDFMTLILSSLWNIGIFKFEEKIFEICPRITRKVWQKLFDLRMPIIMQHLVCLIAWIRVYLKYILEKITVRLIQMTISSLSFFIWQTKENHDILKEISSILVGSMYFTNEKFWIWN